MNANARNSRFLNSILPVTDTSTPGVYTSSDTSYIPYVIGFVLIAVTAGLLYYFQDEVKIGWAGFSDSMNTFFNMGVASATPSPSPSPPPAPTSAPLEAPAPVSTGSQFVSALERVLPPPGSEVFNVSSNKYSYYDAEPLCKALGAELATYDQVKEAWSKGADWCNYGWVKGQMAVYPTSQDTFAKAQLGPEEERGSCGQPGVNGGYFDNPELRYGVNCYGQKPAESSHTVADLSRTTPKSPEAVAFDKKVAKFKQEADTVGILPFNNTRWA
jgi:hypothetical protein